jgi:hypothetical protein
LRRGIGRRGNASRYRRIHRTQSGAIDD